MGNLSLHTKRRIWSFEDVCTSKGGIKRGPTNITINFDVYVRDYINILLHISQWTISEATQYEM